MEHLEVSFTVAYILIIEPAILGDMSGDRSDLFNCSSFVIFFPRHFVLNISHICCIEAARPEPMTAAQLVEHLNRQAVSLMSELLCAHICICQTTGNLNICICSWQQLTRKKCIVK